MDRWLNKFMPKSADYHAIKTSIKNFYYELKGLGSRRLTPAELVRFSHRHKRLLASVDRKPLSPYEGNKLKERLEDIKNMLEAFPVVNDSDQTAASEKQKSVNSRGQNDPKVKSNRSSDTGTDANSHIQRGHILGMNNFDPKSSVEQKKDASVHQGYRSKTSWEESTGAHPKTAGYTSKDAKDAQFNSELSDVSGTKAEKNKLAQVHSTDRFDPSQYQPSAQKYGRSETTKSCQSSQTFENSGMRPSSKGFLKDQRWVDSKNVSLKQENASQTSHPQTVYYFPEKATTSDIYSHRTYTVTSSESAPESTPLNTSSDSGCLRPQLAHSLEFERKGTSSQTNESTQSSYGKSFKEGHERTDTSNEDHQQYRFQHKTQGEFSVHGYTRMGEEKDRRLREEHEKADTTERAKDTFELTTSTGQERKRTHAASVGKLPCNLHNYFKDNHFKLASSQMDTCHTSSVGEDKLGGSPNENISGEEKRKIVDEALGEAAAFARLQCRVGSIDPRFQRNTDSERQTLQENVGPERTSDTVPMTFPKYFPGDSRVTKEERNREQVAKYESSHGSEETNKRPSDVEGRTYLNPVDERMNVDKRPYNQRLTSKGPSKSSEENEDSARQKYVDEGRTNVYESRNYMETDLDKLEGRQSGLVIGTSINSTPREYTLRDSKYAETSSQRSVQTSEESRESRKAERFQDSGPLRDDERRSRNTSHKTGKVTEAAREQPALQILDVHQYFRDDFDVNSIDDSLDYMTKIGILESVAKTYEDKVSHFSEEKYSLEYFVLDEKLMRLIEKLDKIKCLDHEAATAKKVQVIEYIRSLHSKLDERAKED